MNSFENKKQMRGFVHLLLLQLLLFPFFTNAQTVVKSKITFTVNSIAHTTIEGATVNLLRSKDSLPVKTVFSDSKGLVEIEGVRAGNYIIKVTMVGYHQFYTTPFTVSTNEEIKLDPVILSASESALKEVVVSAKKPFIERKLDRFVVNVESSIVSAGSTALEILERSPGVVVDQNDNITVKGRQGVIVMIDGKPSPISRSDLANYLKGLPSNAIERVEIITNPSSKYDAAGNAGIINIIMKKDQRLGMNGNLNMSLGQGVYSRVGQGIMLNYRDKKLNLFGSYNYAYRKGFSHLELNRRFYKNGGFEGAYDQDNFIKVPVTTHLLRVGADYYASKKTVIGFVASGNITGFNRQGNNVSMVFDASNTPASSFGTTNRTEDDNRNHSVNFNLKHTFDSTGKELTVDLDYAKFSTESNQRFVTNYYKIDGSLLLPTYILLGDLGGDLSIRSVKADYVNPIGKTQKIEAGFKASLVKADNVLNFYDNSSGTPVYDPTKSNHFIYDENINAGYINYSKEFPKWNFQLGLRAEQTNIKGNQVVTNQKFDSSYFNLFPSAFINFKLDKKNELGLSVSRRLDRPSYAQLNPFKFFLDPSTYREGNPYLRPQYSYSFELIHNYQSKIITTLSYAITNDVITNVIAPLEGVDKVTVQTDKNLTSFAQYSLNISTPLRVTKWWNTVNNLNFFYGRYKGNLSNTNLNNGQPSFNLSSNQSFTFKNGWAAELSGLYFAPAVYGFMQTKSQWQLSAGVQKPVFNKKGTLRLNITDITWSMISRADIAFRDYLESFRVTRDSRAITLSLTYRFGNNKVAAARRRTTGAEDEKRRAAAGN